MSELGGQSTAAFERLCVHYERELRRQGEQIEALQQRTERQSEENEVLRQQFEQQSAENATLRRAVRAARRASERLGPGLQDARRDVARALELMRQHIRTRDRHRTQDRDLSPSR